VRDFNLNTADNPEWLTPPEIPQALGAFDLDPCSPICRPWDTAKKHYTIEDNGLTQEWFGRVWLNPPYGRETFKWCEKLAHHGSGIALIFARTETRGFYRAVWNRADTVFFFRGRIRFYHYTSEEGWIQQSSANAPSCLVSYSAKDTEAITNSGLEGVLVKVVGVGINELP
jgi:hypothetical protein